ncbi:MAG: class I adenylate-forming enzyme family protein [Xanthobacteraceae bacterium]|nr:class I adenylate-forming enzyme family protein [Xanthobacteraceae bacterium]
MDDWFDYILDHTRSQPEAPAAVMEDRVVTYGMLGAAIDACARRLAAQNFAADDVVALCIADPIRHLTLGLALFRIGIRAISIEPAHRGLSALSFSALVGDEAARKHFPAARLLPLTDDWFNPATAPAVALAEPFSGGRTIWRYSLTSGTTGEPKMLATPLEYVGRNVLPGNAIYGCARTLPMLGLTSIWGFTAACCALASRRTVYFATSPFQAVRMIELFGIDLVFAGTEQLVALVRAARKTGATVDSLRTVIVGGSQMTRALAEAAALHLCKDVRNRYGSSEVGMISEVPAREAVSRPGYAGRVAPGVEIAAFRPDGRPCAPGEAGNVMSRVRRARGAAPDPWVDHGDFGWIDADGAIVILGRTAEIGDLSAPAAREVSPVHEVEHLLRLEWDAADAAAVMVEGDGAAPEIWVGAVDCKDADAAVLQGLMRGRGIAGTVRLFHLQAVPRGANGKVQRGALAAALRAAAAL